MKKILTLSAVVASIALLGGCSSAPSDEGGKALTEKPAGFKGMQGGSASQAPAQGAAATNRGTAAPAGM